MKRILTFTIALVLSFVLSSPIRSNSTARADHIEWIEVQSVALAQTVEIDTPRGSYNAVFQSEVRVFSHGAANGFLTLTVPDGTSSTVLLAEGIVRFNRDGTVARVRLRGRTAEGGRITVIITPAATEDCLIYTTVGTDVDPMIWEAHGNLTLIR